MYSYNKYVNCEKLYSEILTSNIGYKCSGVTAIGNEVTIFTSEVLTDELKQILDDLINVHSPIDPNLVVKKSIQDRKIFGEQLIEDFKLKNLNEGVQWYQAVHLHSRVRAWEVTYPHPIGGTDTVDIFNMILSGDIETASLSLLYGQNDDMSLPTHWITDERRKWLINQMRTWLGWPTI